MKKIGSEIAHWSVLSLIILLLSIGTYQRNSTWNNGLTLWKDCVKKSPRKERPRTSLGFVYIELEHRDNAQKEFEESLRLNPRYAVAVNNLGLVFYKRD